MVRHRAARSDASPSTIVNAIEKVFKLPKGSVKLQYPSGRAARSDSTMANLRKWFTKD